MRYKRGRGGRPHLTALQIKEKIGPAFLDHLRVHKLPADINAHLVDEMAERLARKSRLGNATLKEQLNLAAVLREHRLEKIGGTIAVTIFPDGKVRIIRQQGKKSHF